MICFILLSTADPIQIYDTRLCHPPHLIVLYTGSFLQLETVHCNLLSKLLPPPTQRKHTCCLKALRNLQAFCIIFGYWVYCINVYCSETVTGVGRSDICKHKFALFLKEICNLSPMKSPSCPLKNRFLETKILMEKGLPQPCFYYFLFPVEIHYQSLSFPFTLE